MATKLTKKQQTQLTEKLTGIIQKNNALQLRLSADRSVNEMNVNQISGELNRIHDMAIGKELPTEVNIPVKQSGSGTPSPDNIRPIVGYQIDGIGTVYGGELNIDTEVLTVTYGSANLGSLVWYIYSDGVFFNTTFAPLFKKPANNTIIPNFLCPIYKTIAYFKSEDESLISQDKAISYAPNSGNRLYIHDSRYSDIDTFKSALSEVYLVYELATPETYTLTPKQMIQLLDQL